MDYAEIKKRLGMNSRTETVKCSCCGKELTVPNMYKRKDLDILKPYCGAATVLTIQWMIHHGWHITALDAHHKSYFYCPDCFPEGTPEYQEAPYAKDWCEQAEKWMKENDGKQ